MRKKNNSIKEAAYSKLWRLKKPKKRKAIVERAKSYQKEYIAAYNQIKRDYILNYKKTHSCALCGEVEVACLLFHHREPALKCFAVSHYSSHSIESIIEEIAKCQVLCANCHAKLHYYE